MRTLADRLAGEGYVVLVPDMFWRIEPRFERKDESGMADAFAIVGKFDFGTAVGDIQATHAYLLSIPECTGTVGVVGFCLGGGLAFAAATMSRVDGRGPDAAVCYYGSPVNGLLGQVGNLDCPTVFHYGNTRCLHPGRQDRRGGERRARTGRMSSSTATTPGTRSATGMPRPCTTRRPPNSRGRGPSPSSPTTWSRAVTVEDRFASFGLTVLLAIFSTSRHRRSGSTTGSLRCCFGPG